MSIHKSLKTREGLTRSRNVWKRIERLEALEKASKRQEGDSVYGLPKVRTAMKSKKKPKKVDAAAAATTAEGEGEAAGAEGGAETTPPAK